MVKGCLSHGFQILPDIPRSQKGIVVVYICNILSVQTKNVMVLMYILPQI